MLPQVLSCTLLALQVHETPLGFVQARLPEMLHTSIYDCQCCLQVEHLKEVEQNVTAMIQPLYSKPKPSKNVTVSANLNRAANSVSSIPDSFSISAGD